MSCVPPRGVTGGWRARTQEVKRSSAARADEDEARRRQGQLEWDGTCGGKHYCARANTVSERHGNATSVVTHRAAVSVIGSPSPAALAIAPPPPPPTICPAA